MLVMLHSITPPRRCPHPPSSASCNPNSLPKFSLIALSINSGLTCCGCGGMVSPSPVSLSGLGTRASNEGYPKVREDFTITEEPPTRAFSWLKAQNRVSRHEIGTSTLSNLRESLSIEKWLNATKQICLEINM